MNDPAPLNDKTTSAPLTFHGGKAAAAVPLVFFIVWAIAICVAGAPDENGLILGMVLGC